MQALAESVAPNTPSDIQDKCGYRVWAAKNDGAWQEEAYTPWQSPRWVLHTVDGVEASPEEREAYVKEKQTDAKDATTEAKEHRVPSPKENDTARYSIPCAPWRCSDRQHHPMS